MRRVSTEDDNTVFTLRISTDTKVLAKTIVKAENIQCDRESPHC